MREKERDGEREREGERRGERGRGRETERGGKSRREGERRTEGGREEKEGTERRRKPRGFGFRLHMRQNMSTKCRAHRNTLSPHTPPPSVVGPLQDSLLSFPWGTGPSEDGSLFHIGHCTAPIGRPPKHTLPSRSTLASTRSHLEGRSPQLVLRNNGQGEFVSRTHTGRSTATNR